MIEYNKVFLDTAPLIYFLDDDINFGKKTKQRRFLSISRPTVNLSNS